jgi:hypothetical protein
MTGQEMVFELWRRSQTTARKAAVVPAEAVQRLIQQTRDILNHYGCSKWDADSVLFLIYSGIRWEGGHPTDRVFETLLEFELAEFFSERGIPA